MYEKVFETPDNYMNCGNEELTSPDVIQINFNKLALEKDSADIMIVTITSTVGGWEFYAWVDQGVIYDDAERACE